MSVRLVRKSLAKASLSLLLVLLFAQTGGQAAVTDPLAYSRGFLITGNYVVSGIDLTEARNPPDSQGMANGVINMTEVPEDADVVAAYLYWETITLTSDPSQAKVKFRDQEIDLEDFNIVALKDAPLPLEGSSSTCFSQGVPLTSHMFRADVLSMLPLRLDKDGRNTGMRIANGAHSVSLPTRNGNQVPESAGASLVIVYRHLDEPLRKIVIYDEANLVLPSINETFSQTIQGFYQSSTTKSAKLTHIVASGQPNGNDKIFFNGTQIVPNLVGGTGSAFGTGSTELTDPNDPTSLSEGGSSQRAWGNPTREVGQLMSPGSHPNTTYGETVSTTVEHSPANGGNDCLTWGAVIFSTSVADVDHDGLPDRLETADVQMKDPDGIDLPRLKQMGAIVPQKDLFVEINAMWAPGADPNSNPPFLGTKYGSPEAPFSTTESFIIDEDGHVHLPTPEELKMIGDAYLAKQIHVHFDIGNTSSGSYYRNLGVIQHTDWEDDYTSPAANAYLMTVGVRGGELIEERACDENLTTCQFPDYPGTVGWKFGLQAHRDFPVRDNGQELALDDPSTQVDESELDDWDLGTTPGIFETHRRRFDRGRRGLFHYVLYAHARGKWRGGLPCWENGQPAPYPSGTSCAPLADNQVPSTVSGIADQPGGNIMVTLGLWDEFVGKPYARAATLFHELGHNGNLWHGGLPAELGDQNTATYVEPNCKPFYRSSMNYLYELHGLFDNNGEIRLDYSSVVPASIKETDTLFDLPVSPAGDYQVAWYAPASSALATELKVSAATRFCNGPKFGSTPPVPLMARVHTTLTSDAIDWNGDKLPLPSASCPQSAPNCNKNLVSQDINFDNFVTGTDMPVARSLHGFDDWLAFRLDQIGAGHSFRFTGASSDTGVSEGDTGNSESDTGVSESDTAMSESDTGVSESDTGQSESDTGVSESDLFIGAEPPVTLEGAAGSGRPRPFGLTACVTEDQDFSPTACKAGLPANPPNHRNKLKWKASNFGTALYLIERKRGVANSTNPFVQVGTATGNYFVDAELPNGIPFTYRVRARFDDDPPADFSDHSNTVTITAVNEAPVAVADVYNNVPKNNFNVQAPGVLDNDTDVDSSKSSFRAVKYTQTFATGCQTGTLTLNANGSFTYKSKGNALQDVCHYVANDGVWNVDGVGAVPMSGNSNPFGTITFNIKQ